MYNALRIMSEHTPNTPPGEIDEVDERIPSPQGFPFAPESKHRPLNSIDIVESFFGQELDDEIIAAVRKMPRDQQLVLLSTIHTEIQEESNAFGLMRGYVQRGILTSEDATIMCPEYAQDPTLLSGEIHAHELPLRMTEPRADIASAAGLKHLALYTQHTILKDPLSTTRYGLPHRWWWSEEPDPTDPEALAVTDEEEQYWANTLADRLKQLQPLADLIRSNCLVLQWHQELESPYNDSPVLPLIPSQLEDPFIGWLLRQPTAIAALKTLGDYQNRQLADYERDRIEAEIVRSLYPIQMPPEKFWGILKFTHEAKINDLTPVTSDPDLIYHLSQYTRMLLDREPPVLIPPRYDETLAPAIEYQLPNLSEVSFKEIVKVRHNEEIFDDVRTSLNALGRICASEAGTGSYASFKDFVIRYAPDIIQPSLDKLQSWQSKVSRRRFGGIAVASTVNLALRGGALLAHVPVAGMAGTPVSKVTQKVINKKPDQQAEEIEIACKILKSIY